MKNKNKKVENKKQQETYTTYCGLCGLPITLHEGEDSNNPKYHRKGCTYNPN